MDDQQKIRHYPSLLYADDLDQICNPLKCLGITYFAHVRVDHENQFSGVALKPEFVKLYLEKAYYNYDLHMHASKKDEQYIVWDALELTEESQELRDDIHSLGFGHTFSIVQQTPQAREYFHFASELNRPSMNNVYLEKLDELKKFTLYFKDKLYKHKELRESHNVKFSLSCNGGGFFIKDKLPLLDDESFHRQIDLDRIYLDTQGGYITKREFECLYWMSLAKTTEDIAKLLSITPRTVKAHIASIKKKLSCHTQFQLGMIYQRLNTLFDSNE